MTGYICSLILCSFLAEVLGKIGFPKSQQMDAHVFPPPIERAAARGIPDGHLRPLGYQKKSSGKVSETLEMPTPHAFYIRYIKSNTPVHIHEAYTDLPVFKTWEKDNYLKEKYGSLNISVTVKKQTSRLSQQTMTMKKFLLDYMYEEWYLSNTVPEEMRSELPLPGCLKCGTYNHRLQEAELWMSSGGASSLLHSHEDHNLHCALFGRKDFIVIDEKYRRNFDFKEKYFHAGAGYSNVDMDMVNMFKFPEIQKTPWYHAIVRPGDCMFVPAGYLHQVRSYGRGISFTVLFSPSKEFDSSDCSRKDPSEKIVDPTLADGKFIWTFKNGSRILSHEKMDPDKLRNILEVMMRSKDDLFREQFEHFFNDAMSQFPDHVPASEVFDKLEEKLGHDYISKTDLSNLSTKILSKIADIFNNGGIKKDKKKDEL